MEFLQEKINVGESGDFVAGKGENWDYKKVDEVGDDIMVPGLHILDKLH